MTRGGDTNVPRAERLAVAAVGRGRCGSAALAAGRLGLVAVKHLDLFLVSSLSPLSSSEKKSDIGAADVHFLPRKVTRAHGHITRRSHANGVDLRFSSGQLRKRLARFHATSDGCRVATTLGSGGMPPFDAVPDRERTQLSSDRCVRIDRPGSYVGDGRGDFTGD
jgi:hypothetical protein